MNLRDLNLEFKGNTKLPVSTCVKTMRTSSCLRILHPTTFSFKEESVLAAHPPSCHPRRVFGYPESERKLEKLEKEREELKASRPKILLIKKSPLQCHVLGSFIDNTLQNYQKIITITITMGANRGDKQKVTKKVKMSKA